MSDELTRAIAEALGCERDEFIDQEGGRRPFCNEHGFIATGWPCPQAEDVAAAITPLIEARVREARAEAWDEGYRRGTLDATSDLEPADNPYREEVRRA